MWRAALWSGREKQPTMTDAVEAGVPILFTARGGLRFAIRFGPSVQAQGGPPLRPAASAELVLPDGARRRLHPCDKEDEC
jgi:hypothetical protein